MNRAEMRGKLEALDASADVRFVNLSAASITEWHSEFSV